MKGVALIFELDKDQIVKAFELGIEIGYFYQFGIFAYIMTGVISKQSSLGNDDNSKVKEHLYSISNILQFLSFESMEKMLYQMKTLNIAQFQNEFLMLTQFHYQRIEAKLDEMEVDEGVKEKIREQISTFKSDLFDMAKYKD